MSVTIDRVSAVELMALRKRVLRDGLDEPPAAHPDDDLPGTVHLAARDDDGEVIGCVSLVRSGRAFGKDEVPVHLILMAVAPELQGQGVGERLIDAAKAAVVGEGDLIWAAARSTALGFYERCGFRVVSDEFVGAMHLLHHFVVWSRA